MKKVEWGLPGGGEKAPDSWERLTYRCGMRSLKSLAEELGVSVATISNALNDKGKMAAPLREKIKERARKYGYEPSAHARVLHGQRMPVLGIIVSSVHDGLVQGFFQGADRAASAAGYSSIFSVSNQPGSSPTEREIQAVARFHALRIGGVLYLPWGGTAEGAVERELEKRDIPFVRIYRQGRSSSHPSVTVDHARGVELAMVHLLELGHRRIALMEPQGSEAGQVRKAFQRLSPQSDWKEWAFPHSMEDWDRLIKKRATAILAESDDQALALVDWLQQRGKSVPADVSVIGFRDTIVARSMSPRLTTLRVPTEEIGYRAAEWLIQKIQGNAGSDRLRESLPPTLVVRASTQAPRS